MAVLGSLKFLIEADSTPVQRSAAAAAKALARLEGSIDQFNAGLKQQTRLVDQAERAHDKLAKTVATGAQTQEKSAAGWAKEIAIFQRYRAALYLVGAAAENVYKLMEEGARTGAAAQYFRNAGKSIEEYRRATKGLISDADLMKKANLADTMGLSGDTFKTLANVAHASAAKTGQSFQHMLDSIILGTARESRLLLDNLGIIINVTDAKKAYAKTLKEGADGAKYESVSVEQLANALTDAGEKAAFFEEVSRKGYGPLLEQAQVGATAADNFDRFAAAVENLKTAIGRLLAEGSSSLIANLAKQIGEIADSLDRVGRFGMVKKGGLVDTLTGAVGKAYNFAKGGMPYDPTSILAGAAGLAAGPTALTTGAPLALLEKAVIDDLSSGVDANSENARREFDALARQVHDAKLSVQDIPELAKAVTEYPAEMSRWYGTTILDIIPKLKALGDQLGVIWKPGQTKKGGVGPGGSGAVDPETLKRIQDEANKKWKKALEDREDAERKHVAAVLKYEKEMFDKDMELRKSAAEKLFDFYRRVLHKETQAERMSRATAMGMGVVSQHDADRAVRAENDQLRKDENQRKQQEIAGGVDQAHSVISAAMSGSASALGAGIGGFFGPLGTAIGSLIGELLDPLTPVIELLGHLASGIKGLLELGLNPFLRTLEPLGPALEFLLRAIGVLIAGALRPLIPHMQALVFVVTALIDLVGWVLVVFASLAEITMSLTTAFMLVWGFVWNLISLLSGGHISDFNDSMSYAAVWIDLFTKGVIDNIITLNNGIVDFVRGLGYGLRSIFGEDFGLHNFGDKLTRADLMPDTTPIDDNTDATSDNTRAVEQLSRDLRNLPSGYKVNYALYGATAPVRQYPGVSDSIAAANRSRYGGNPPNYRWRT